MSQAIKIKDQEGVSQERSELINIMTVIERCALNPDVDIDKMQKLLDMQERILNRNAKQAFAAGLAQMQADLPEIKEHGEIKIVSKDNGSSRTQGKYALFEDINEQVKPILTKHGFAISFRINQGDGKIKVTAILSHALGHSEETQLELPVDSSGSKNAVQSVGSSVSYGKRYTMCAILNITARGEDDDGRKTAAEPLATPAQQKAIEALASKLTDKRLESFLSTYPDLTQIKKSEVNTIMARLNNALAAQAKGAGVSNG